MRIQNEACLMTNKKDTMDSLEDSALYSHVKSLESVLSTRLSDETYRGLLNYAKSTVGDASIAKTQTALVSPKILHIRNSKFVKFHLP